MTAQPLESEWQMTEAEYLAFEDEAETKHEYVDGTVYDWPGYEYGPEGLSGASDNHNRIVINLIVALDPAARAAGCQVYATTRRLRVRRHSRRYYYPDLMVRCGPPAPEDDDLHTSAPCLVIEVMSRRSQRIDRSEKLQTYQSIASVRQYLVVAQDQRRVTACTRLGDGWAMSQASGSQGIGLACLSKAGERVLFLDAIYQGVIE